MSKKNMNSVLRKAVSLLLIVFLASGVFAGCSSDKSSTKKNVIEANLESNKPASWISDTPLELSILYADNTAYPFNQDWEVLKEITKRTNVSLKIQVVPDSDYLTKAKIIINSGDIPDFVTKLAAEDVAAFAPGGAILPVSDYSSKLPNYTNLIKKWNLGEEMSNLAENNGKTYGFPGFYEIQLSDIGLFVRADILKKHSLQEPKTYDDLYVLLKKLKELYPSIYPLNCQYNLKLLAEMMGPSFNTGIGDWLFKNGYKFDYQQDKWIFTANSPDYREMLRYMSKLLKEGLMDPELFSDSTDQWLKKMTTDKSFVTYGYFSRIGAIESDGKKATNNADFAMKTILPLAGPQGKRLTFYKPKFSTYVATPSAITKKPYFDKFLKFADWFIYSDEAINLLSWGIEGKSYEMVNGKKAMPTKYKPTPQSPLSLDWRKDFGLRTNSLSFNRPKDFELEFNDPRMVDYIQQLADGKLYDLPYKTPKLTSDEKEQENLTNFSIQDYVQKSCMEFIFGKKNLDTDWDEYVKECEKKGRDKMLDLYNMDWSRQKKATGK